MNRVLSSVTLGVALSATSVCFANAVTQPSQTLQQSMQQQNLPVLQQGSQQVIVKQASPSTHVPGAWSRIEGCRALFLLDGKPTLAFLQGIHRDGSVFMESTLKHHQTNYTPMLGGFLYQAYGDGSERFHVLKVERLIPDLDLSGQATLQGFTNDNDSFVAILGADAMPQQGPNQKQKLYSNTRWIMTLDDGRRIDVIGQCNWNR